MGAVWRGVCARIAAGLVAGGWSAVGRVGPDIILCVLVAGVVVPWVLGLVSPAAARTWKIGLLVLGVMAAGSIGVDAAEFGAARAAPPAVMALVGGPVASAAGRWQAADWRALHPSSAAGARNGADLWLRPLGSSAPARGGGAS